TLLAGSASSRPREGYGTHVNALRRRGEERVKAADSSEGNASRTRSREIHDGFAARLRSFLTLSGEEEVLCASTDVSWPSPRPSRARAAPTTRRQPPERPPARSRSRSRARTPWSTSARRGPRRS